MSLGFALDWLHPIPRLPAVAARILGVTHFVLGAALAWAAQAALRRAGANVCPIPPTPVLETGGPV